MRAALLRRALARALDFADRGLARDYDHALAKGINRTVRDRLLRFDDVARREYGTYADARAMMPPVRGNVDGIPNWPRPPSALRGAITAHHTHPVISPEKDWGLSPARYDGIAPFSEGDFRSLADASSRVRGSFAHEATGGGSYAERTGRLVARPAVERAITRGERAAQKRMRDAPTEQGYNSQAAALIALGRAAKRVGLLRRYGYRPSTPEAADALEAMAPTMTRAEREALDVMHSTIYGLPRPLTYGRIMGAGALGGGAYALRQALLDRRNQEE